MLSWSDCFFFYQWLTNFSRLLPIFSETLSPPLNFLFSGFFFPPMSFFSPPLRLYLLLIVLPLSPFSPMAYCPLVFFMPHIFSIFPLFYFPSFLSCLAFRHPHRRLITATALQDLVIIKHAWTLPPPRPLLLPPVLLPPIAFTFYLRLFLLYSPVFHSWLAFLFYCSPPLFSFLIFIAISSVCSFFCYGLDLLLTLLMQFWNTFPQLSRVIYLQNNRQALTQVSFALLSFYGWHAPKGGQLLFRFLLLSGFLPYPFATYHFFLTFVLSLVFSRFTWRCFFLVASVAMVIFLIFRPFLAALFSLRFVLNFSHPLIHLSHFSYFQYLYVFPDFGYQRIFSWKLRSPVFLSPPLRLLLPLNCLSFFNTPFSLFCCSPLYETLQFSRQVIFRRLFA